MGLIESGFELQNLWGWNWVKISGNLLLLKGWASIRHFYVDPFGSNGGLRLAHCWSEVGMKMMDSGNSDWNGKVFLCKDYIAPKCSHVALTSQTSAPN